jgi:hypothetical protein
MSEIVAALRRFSGGCCFQVIYFKSNIFFSPPIEASPRARAETARLTHAVNNAWRVGIRTGLEQLAPLEGGEAEKV